MIIQLKHFQKKLCQSFGITELRLKLIVMYLKCKYLFFKKLAKNIKFWNRKPRIFYNENI